MAWNLIASIACPRVRLAFRFTLCSKRIVGSHISNRDQTRYGQVETRRRSYDTLSGYQITGLSGRDKGLNSVRIRVFGRHKMATRSVTLTLDENALAHTASLTREFSQSLSRAGVKNSIATNPAPPGARGDAITIGQILIDLTTSGAITALIECAKAYLLREKELVLKVTSPNGSVVVVNSHNIEDESIVRALQ